LGAGCLDELECFGGRGSGFAAKWRKAGGFPTIHLKEEPGAKSQVLGVQDKWIYRKPHMLYIYLVAHMLYIYLVAHMLYMYLDLHREPVPRRVYRQLIIVVSQEMGREPEDGFTHTQTGAYLDLHREPVSRRVYRQLIIVVSQGIRRETEGDLSCHAWGDASVVHREAEHGHVEVLAGRWEQAEVAYDRRHVADLSQHIWVSELVCICKDVTLWT